MQNGFQNVSWPGWEVVRLIGQGSFGAVYEIERQTFDNVEKAALKVISIPQNASDIDEMYSEGYDAESITCTFRNHLESVVAEYALMRKMNGSANIVNSEDIHYIQHDDGIGWDIFIKMELLTPITKLLAADISETAVVKLAKDMCKALELCKKHGIVHRDIKPQNIFVSEHGDYKLGDFGIAKTIEGTMGGTKIGTYKYMAPEVYNNQPYGSSADLYSLGLVLYWLLNERRMPFIPMPPEKMTAGMDEKSRQRRFSGEAIPAPAHGSPELKRIVLKACAFHPGDRYASPTAMLEDLSPLDDGTNNIKQPDNERTFCSNCGNKYAAGARFCKHCGAQIPSASESVKPAPEPVKPEPAPGPVAQPVYQPAAQQQSNYQYAAGEVHNGKVGFGKAISLFFKNYAKFSGRASKREYWLTVLFNIILLVPIIVICGFVPPLGVLLMLAIALPNLSLSVRRLHDVGKSGKFLFMGLIPIAGGIILLVQYFRGSDKDNRWGPGPKGR